MNARSTLPGGSLFLFENRSLQCALLFSLQPLSFFFQRLFTFIYHFRLVYDCTVHPVSLSGATGNALGYCFIMNSDDRNVDLLYWILFVIPFPLSLKVTWRALQKKSYGLPLQGHLLNKTAHHRKIVTRQRGRVGKHAGHGQSSFKSFLL